MGTDKDHRSRDTKKLALANAARLKRSTRKKLEKHATGSVTEAMVSEALTKRNIDQIDNFSRTVSDGRGHGKNDGGQEGRSFSSITQIPFKSLKKNVVWLKTAQQDACTMPTLSDELTSFANYVQLDSQERAARQSMLLDIQDAVQSKFPVASISLFGSYPVGLSIFTSDIDISVDNIFDGNDNAAQEANALEGSVGWAKRSLHYEDSDRDRDRDGVEAQPANKRIRFEEQAGVSADLKAVSGFGSTGTAVVEENGEAEEVSWSIDCYGGGAGISTALSVEEKVQEERVGDSCRDGASSDGSEYEGSDWEDAGRASLTPIGTGAEPAGSGAKVKLPLDIDVPVWDGLSAGACNAALGELGGDDGVLREAAVHALLHGHHLSSSSGLSLSLREQRAAAEQARRQRLEVLGKMFKVIKVSCPPSEVWSAMSL